jgi:hypothetical protein
MKPLPFGCLFLLVAGSWAAAAAEAPKPTEFDLKEVSAFSLDRHQMFNQWTLAMTRGQSVPCQNKADPQVKAYPTLKSEKPLYGSLVLGTSTALQRLAAGTVFHFVIDESGGTGKGYDRLYFDLNHDLDLTSDKPAAVGEQPKGLPWSFPAGTKVTWFEALSIPWDYGPGLGVRPFSVQPRLQVESANSASLYFISPTIRQGKISVGNHVYEVVLGHAYQLSPRYDGPHTAMYLTLVDDADTQDVTQIMGDYLSQMRPVDGKWYGFAASPTGDKLTVKEYQGDVGVLAVGKGDRKLEGPVSMNGTLQGSDRYLPVANYGPPLAAGPKDPKARPLMVERITLPAGDYTPTYLSVQMGQLEVTVSNNYYGDGERAPNTGNPILGIKVRKDQPFVLDFSNPAAIVFTSPAKEARVKPGQELRVEAVLVDPALDIMIRGLTDTSRTVKQEVVRTYTNAPDQSVTIEMPARLDPKVVITNAAGKPVAEGVMPFG